MLQWFEEYNRKKKEEDAQKAAAAAAKAKAAIDTKRGGTHGKDWWLELKQRYRRRASRKRVTQTDALREWAQQQMEKAQQEAQERGSSSSDSDSDDSSEEVDKSQSHQTSGLSVVSSLTAKSSGMTPTMSEQTVTKTNSRRRTSGECSRGVRFTICEATEEEQKNLADTDYFFGQEGDEPKKGNSFMDAVAAAVLAAKRGSSDSGASSSQGRDAPPDGESDRADSSTKGARDRVLTDTITAPAVSVEQMRQETEDYGLADEQLKGYDWSPGNRRRSITDTPEVEDDAKAENYEKDAGLSDAQIQHFLEPAGTGEAPIRESRLEADGTGQPEVGRTRLNTMQSTAESSYANSDDYGLADEQIIEARRRFSWSTQRQRAMTESDAGCSQGDSEYGVSDQQLERLNAFSKNLGDLPASDRTIRRFKTMSEGRVSLASSVGNESASGSRKSSGLTDGVYEALVESRKNTLNNVAPEWRDADHEKEEEDLHRQIDELQRQRPSYVSNTDLRTSLAESELSGKSSSSRKSLVKFQEAGTTETEVKGEQQSRESVPDDPQDDDEINRSSIRRSTGRRSTGGGPKRVSFRQRTASTETYVVDEGSREAAKSSEDTANGIDRAHRNSTFTNIYDPSEEEFKGIGSEGDDKFGLGDRQIRSFCWNSEADRERSLTDNSAAASSTVGRPSGGHDSDFGLSEKQLQDLRKNYGQNASLAEASAQRLSIGSQGEASLRKRSSLGSQAVSEGNADPRFRALSSSTDGVDALDADFGLSEGQLQEADQLTNFRERGMTDSSSYSRVSIGSTDSAFGLSQAQITRLSIKYSNVNMAELLEDLEKESLYSARRRGTGSSFAGSRNGSRRPSLLDGVDEEDEQSPRCDEQPPAPLTTQEAITEAKRPPKRHVTLPRLSFRSAVRKVIVEHAAGLAGVDGAGKQRVSGGEKRVSFKEGLLEDCAKAVKEDDAIQAKRKATVESASGDSEEAGSDTEIVPPAENPRKQCRYSVIGDPSEDEGKIRGDSDFGLSPQQLGNYSWDDHKPRSMTGDTSDAPKSRNGSTVSDSAFGLSEDQLKELNTPHDSPMGNFEAAGEEIETSAAVEEDAESMVTMEDGQKKCRYSIIGDSNEDGDKLRGDSDSGLSEKQSITGDASNAPVPRTGSVVSESGVGLSEKQIQDLREKYGENIDIAEAAIQKRKELRKSSALSSVQSRKDSAASSVESRKDSAVSIAESRRDSEAPRAASAQLSRASNGSNVSAMVSPMTPSARGEHSPISSIRLSSNMGEDDLRDSEFGLADSQMQEIEKTYNFRQRRLSNSSVASISSSDSEFGISDRQIRRVSLQNADIPGDLDNLRRMNSASSVSSAASGLDEDFGLSDGQIRRLSRKYSNVDIHSLLPDLIEMTHENSSSSGFHSARSDDQSRKSSAMDEELRGSNEVGTGEGEARTEAIEAPEVAWNTVSGFIVGDALHQETMTISEARDKCNELPGCSGFYYQGSLDAPLDQAVSITFGGTSEIKEGWRTYTSCLMMEADELSQQMKRLSRTVSNASSQAVSTVSRRKKSRTSSTSSGETVTHKMMTLGPNGMPRAEDLEDDVSDSEFGLSEEQLQDLACLCNFRQRRMTDSFDPGGDDDDAESGLSSDQFARLREKYGDNLSDTAAILSDMGLSEAAIKSLKEKHGDDLQPAAILAEVNAESGAVERLRSPKRDEPKAEISSDDFSVAPDQGEHKSAQENSFASDEKTQNAGQVPEACQIPETREDDGRRRSMTNASIRSGRFVSDGEFGLSADQLEELRNLYSFKERSLTQTTGGDGNDSDGDFGLSDGQLEALREKYGDNMHAAAEAILTELGVPEEAIQGLKEKYDEFDLATVLVEAAAAKERALEQQDLEAEAAEAKKAAEESLCLVSQTCLSHIYEQSVAAVVKLQEREFDPVASEAAKEESLELLAQVYEHSVSTIREQIRRDFENTELDVQASEAAREESIALLSQVYEVSAATIAKLETSALDPEESKMAKRDSLRSLSLLYEESIATIAIQQTPELRHSKPPSALTTPRQSQPTLTSPRQSQFAKRSNSQNSLRIRGPAEPQGADLCCGGHALEKFVADERFNYVGCNVCGNRARFGTFMYGCRICNFDKCGDCRDKAAEAEACSAAHDRGEDHDQDKNIAETEKDLQAFNAGDRVVTDQDLKSDGYFPIKLPKGIEGVVSEIKHNGDAVITFEGKDPCLISKQNFGLLRQSEAVGDVVAPNTLIVESSDSGKVFTDSDFGLSDERSQELMQLHDWKHRAMTDSLDNSEDGDADLGLSDEQLEGLRQKYGEKIHDTEAVLNELGVPETTIKGLKDKYSDGLDLSVVVTEVEAAKSMKAAKTCDEQQAAGDVITLNTLHVDNSASGRVFDDADFGLSDEQLQELTHLHNLKQRAMTENLENSADSDADFGLSDEQAEALREKYGEKLHDTEAILCDLGVPEATIKELKEKYNDELDLIAAVTEVREAKARKAAKDRLHHCNISGLSGDSDHSTAVFQCAAWGDVEAGDIRSVSGSRLSSEQREHLAQIRKLTGSTQKSRSSQATVDDNADVGKASVDISDEQIAALRSTYGDNLEDTGAILKAMRVSEATIQALQSTYEENLDAGSASKEVTKMRQEATVQDLQDKYGETLPVEDVLKEAIVTTEQQGDDAVPEEARKSATRKQRLSSSGSVDDASYGFSDEQLLALQAKYSENVDASESVPIVKDTRAASSDLLLTEGQLQDLTDIDKWSKKHRLGSSAADSLTYSLDAASDSGLSEERVASLQTKYGEHLDNTKAILSDMGVPQAMIQNLESKYGEELDIGKVLEETRAAAYSQDFSTRRDTAVLEESTDNSAAVEESASTAVAVEDDKSEVWQDEKNDDEEQEVAVDREETSESQAESAEKKPPGRLTLVRNNLQRVKDTLVKSSPDASPLKKRGSNPSSELAVMACGDANEFEQFPSEVSSSSQGEDSAGTFLSPKLLRRHTIASYSIGGAFPSPPSAPTPDTHRSAEPDPEVTTVLQEAPPSRSSAIAGSITEISREGTDMAATATAATSRSSHTPPLGQQQQMQALQAALAEMLPPGSHQPHTLPIGNFHDLLSPQALLSPRVSDILSPILSPRGGGSSEISNVYSTCYWLWSGLSMPLMPLVDAIGVAGRSCCSREHEKGLTDRDRSDAQGIDPFCLNAEESANFKPRQVEATSCTVDAERERNELEVAPEVRREELTRPSVAPEILD